jgi:hypothetical protein
MRTMLRPRWGFALDPFEALLGVAIYALSGLINWITTAHLSRNCESTVGARLNQDQYVLCMHQCRLVASHEESETK